MLMFIILIVFGNIFIISNSQSIACKNYCSAKGGEICEKSCCKKGYCFLKECTEPLMLKNWLLFKCPFQRNENQGKCMSLEVINSKTENAFSCKFCPKCSISKDCHECRLEKEGDHEIIICNCEKLDCIQTTFPNSFNNCNCVKKSKSKGFKCSFNGEWKIFPEDCKFCQTFTFAGNEETVCNCLLPHCTQNEQVNSDESLLNINNGKCESCEKVGIGYVCNFCSNCTIPLFCDNCEKFGDFTKCKCPDDSCIEIEIPGFLPNEEPFWKNNGICESCDFNSGTQKYSCNFCSSCTFNIGCRNCELLEIKGQEKISCECQNTDCLNHVNKSFDQNGCQCNKLENKGYKCKFEGDWQSFPKDCKECHGFGKIKQILTTICKCDVNHCS